MTGAPESQPVSLTAQNAPLALARGIVLQRRLAADPVQAYYVYVPKSGGKGAPVFVTVHGISRNALEHIESFAPMADAFGVVLIAPHFDRDRHPDFQRLGRDGRGARADHALDAILEEVCAHSGACGERLYLFGFSGGAQFAHRYAFAHPDRVAAMVLGAAGWYTFPDAGHRYPRGIRECARLPGVTFDKSRFLRIPTMVVVGERDTARDTVLNTSAKIDQQQGSNRFERARRWVKAMRAAAEWEGLTTPYILDTLPRTGHSFTRCVMRGQIASRTFCFLFGAANHHRRSRASSE